MRFLDLRECSNARERGQVHGESFAGEIRSLAQIRLHLACKISGFSSPGLVEVASMHLPILRDFDADLYDELLGLAEGSGCSAEEIIILNQYTDIRDLSPEKWGAASDRCGGAASFSDDADYDGGCTIVWSRTKSGPIFAQTWDMHASALPYVMMLRIPDAAGDDAYLLSLTGCLGMAGLNGAGLCIGINNLTSTDAQPGVVWSAIVRRVLRESAVSAARDMLLGARVGSGHHYLVCDSSSVASVETSGMERKVVFRGESDDYVHSNHCLDADIAKCSRIPPMSTTKDRQDAMRAQLSARPIEDLDDAWQRLGSHEGYPRSICTNMSTFDAPHAAATCAGLAIDPTAKRLLAVAGFTHNVKPEEFLL